MKKQYIYIDDSGDPGFKKSNTPQLVVAAVVVIDEDNIEKISAAINGFRAGLKWNELHEFKFSSTKKSIIKDLLRFVRQFEFVSYAAVIDKTKIATKPQLSSGETLYNYAIKELLLRLDLSEPIIIIDGVANKKPAMATRSYLRHALKLHGVKKCKISFVDSRKDSIIQLADIVAGSVARSYDKSKTDYNDCLKLLITKIKEIYKILP